VVGEEEAAFEQGTGADVVEGGCSRAKEITIGTYEVMSCLESDGGGKVLFFAVVAEGLRGCFSTEGGADGGLFDERGDGVSRVEKGETFAAFECY